MAKLLSRSMGATRSAADEETHERESRRATFESTQSASAQRQAHRNFVPREFSRETTHAIGRETEPPLNFRRIETHRREKRNRRRRKPVAPFVKSHGAGENNMRVREMRKKTMTAMFLALAPVSGLALVGSAAPAQAQQAEVNISLFFDQLSTDGRWAQHPRWGWVWYPTTVDANWRPYTRGRWVWTEEYGWYWQSEERFGWATYHYGRWGYDDVYGWVWVPGDRWAPAWVAFRYSDQAIGWAPLPPETINVASTVEIDDSIYLSAYYQPRWVFVEPRYFVEPRIYSRVVPPERNATYLRASVNVTNIRISGDVFVNRSFEPQRIRAAVGRDIPRVRVQRVNTVNNVRINQTNVVNVYNPRVRIDRDRAPPERARARDNDRPRVNVRPELVRPDDRRDRARDRDRDSGRDNDRNRGADRDRTPGTPDRDRAAPNDRTPGQRGQPPRTTPDRATPSTPATPPDRDRAQPDRNDRDGRERAQPGQPGRPNATPPSAAPPGASPGAPPTPRAPGRDRDDDRNAQPNRPNATPPNAAPPGPVPPTAAPPARPGQPARPGDEGRERGRDNNRGADRGATPAQPAQPPARPQPENRREAAPPQAQPPSAAPGAPPSRAQPPARPPQAQPPQRKEPNRGEPNRGQQNRGQQNRDDDEKKNGR
jgi:hypothetical protein